MIKQVDPKEGGGSGGKFNGVVKKAKDNKELIIIVIVIIAIGVALSQ